MRKRRRDCFYLFISPLIFSPPNEFLCEITPGKFKATFQAGLGDIWGLLRNENVFIFPKQPLSFWVLPDWTGLDWTVLGALGCSVPHACRVGPHLYVVLGPAPGKHLSALDII